MGKADYGMDIECIVPVDDKIEVVGASSDHTVIDLHDTEIEYKVGDIVRFSADYAAVMYSSGSPDVTICFD